MFLITKNELPEEGNFLKNFVAGVQSKQLHKRLFKYIEDYNLQNLHDIGYCP